MMEKYIVELIRVLCKSNHTPIIVQYDMVPTIKPNNASATAADDYACLVVGRGNVSCLSQNMTFSERNSTTQTAKRNIYIFSFFLLNVCALV